jgi:hypothetical protein
MMNIKLLTHISDKFHCLNMTQAQTKIMSNSVNMANFLDYYILILTLSDIKNQIRFESPATTINGGAVVRCYNI